MTRRNFIKSVILSALGLGVIVSVNRVLRADSQDTVDLLMEIVGIPDGLRKDVEYGTHFLQKRYGTKFGLGVAALKMASLPFLGSFIPRSAKERIYAFWAKALMLSSRSLAWQYVNYPEVSEESICDGLITDEAMAHKCCPVRNGFAS